MIWDVQQFSDALRRWTAFFGKHKKAEEIWGDRKSKTQVCKNAEVHLHIQGGQDVFADGAVSVGVSEYRIGWTWNCSGFLPWILCNWGLMEQDLLVECCGSLSFLYAGDAHVWTSSLLLLGEPIIHPAPWEGHLESVFAGHWQAWLSTKSYGSDGNHMPLNICHWMLILYAVKIH